MTYSELADQLEAIKALSEKMPSTCYDRFGNLCADHMEAIIAALRAEGVAQCEWKPDDDGVYWTTCGNAFTFIDAGPKENKMAHCCYCGGKLVAL